MQRAKCCLPFFLHWHRTRADQVFLQSMTYFPICRKCRITDFPFFSKTSLIVCHFGLPVRSKYRGKNSKHRDWVPNPVFFPLPAYRPGVKNACWEVSQTLWKNGKEVCGMGRRTERHKLESKAESRDWCYYSQSKRFWWFPAAHGSGGLWDQAGEIHFIPCAGAAYLLLL